MSGEQRRFELSVPQVLGGALAAVTAAVAASYLGVAGTVIGAAVASVASTVGSAIYTHYLKRTGEKVKEHTVLAWRDDSGDDPGDPATRTLVRIVPPDDGSRPGRASGDAVRRGGPGTQDHGVRRSGPGGSLGDGVRRSALASSMDAGRDEPDDDATDVIPAVGGSAHDTKAHGPTAHDTRAHGAPGGADSTLVMAAVAEPRERRPLPWLKLGFAAALIFAISMGAIAIYTVASGSSIPDQLPGRKSDNSTEHQKAPVKDDKPSDQPTHAPTTQDETTPDPTPTPTPTPTPKPSKTPTTKPTPTPTKTDQVEPSGDPTTTPPEETGQPESEDSPPPDDPAQQDQSSAP